MPRLQQLLERRANAWEQYQEILNRSTDDGFTAEDREALDRAEADVRQMSDDIERIQRAESLEHTIRPDDVNRDGVGAGTVGDDGSGDTRSSDEQFAEAFVSYLRHGQQDMSSEERSLLRDQFVSGGELRAQGVSTGGAGGYTVPEEFQRRLTESMLFYGAMLDVANVITTTTGATLPWPGNDDTANKGALLAENTQATEQDITFTETQLDAYMYTSKLVRVSIQLLQDSAFNLDEWLPRKLGERIGRIVNEHLTVGDGSSKPLGIVPGGTVAVTAASTTAITYGELIDLEHAVDPAYRNERAVYMFADTALAGLRKILDGDGRPLWQPSVAAGAADTFNGRRFVINQDMADPAAAAKSVVFGDLYAGYVARRVQGSTVLRLTERYADYLQVGFLGFERWDGTPDDTGAYAVLQQAAS